MQCGRPGSLQVKNSREGGARRHRSNREWIERHLNDPYVKAATRDGYRSRAAYKLIEIDDKDRLVRPGATVVELGAAPGSWSQVLLRRLAPKPGGRPSRLVGLDLLPMEPLPGLEFIQGDFHEIEVEKALSDALGGRPVDLVLSDMSPNLSGIAAADAARSIALCELALEFAVNHLAPNGDFLVKCFHGSGYSQYVEQLKRRFRSVAPRKPAASRSESSEVYLLARGLKPVPAGRSAESGVPEGGPSSGPSSGPEDGKAGVTP